MTAASLRAAVDERASALGFASVRVTTPDRVPDQRDRLADWLGAGRHGEMGWMAETADRRRHPSALWPQAKSIIVLGWNYAPDVDPLATLPLRDRATISVYARRRDYHDVVKGRLKELAGFVAAKVGGDVKVFVDTAPLMEKPVAQAAGLGWQGKHTALVSRERGAWLFLGFILTTAEIAPDEAEVDHCGSCRRCLDICPTNAFPAPYQLDSTRCIAYLTNEHAGPIPHEYRPLIGNRVFGCDDCLAVCPWNKFAEASRDARMALRADLAAPPLKDMLTLDDAAFRKLFAGTPIKRAGRARFLRNVLIAVGNSNDRSLIAATTPLLDDASPIVRGAAIWALSRLMAESELADERMQRLMNERDDDVRGEWLASIGEGAIREGSLA